MKLSVSAFRAQASAQRKILSSYQNQLNYGTCTSFSALGRYSPDGKPQMMVDSTGLSPTSSSKPNAGAEYGEGRLAAAQQAQKEEKVEKEAAVPLPTPGRQEGTPALEKSPGRTRSRSNQRWMKLRTTVQLSGAISGTSQKSKPPLKREDSFLKRFSTRQIPETQETVDTGDETETLNGSQTQNEVNRRRRKRRKEMSKTVVNPDENFYFYWLMTVTICVLYNLWTLIVRQSFPELQGVASAFWYSGDGFADVVFVCDIVVQFRTGYLEQGLMVYDSKKLATHYLKSRAFALDILSLLPLDFLQMNFGINPMLRFPRFFKIYRVYTYYYMVESRTVYPNLWRVVNLIHILLILAHWFGCFYYLLSEAEGFQGDWVYPHRPGDYATLTRKYLGSLYWSTLTLTTIGDLPTPETNAEYLFTIISYLIGVFIFATIVGQVGNVITNRNANRLEFERLLDGAKTYMRHHKVPGGMKRRVLRWYDYSWSRGRIQGGGDINTALGLLPDKLKTELALHVNLSVLKKVTIFQECQPEFLHDLVLKMKAYIFTPGDLICRKGEVAREMFIIADGILDVISETGRVLTTMKAGDFFGEIGILNLDGLNKRTADVRSVGYSELFSLSREDVLTAMKDYPEAQEILQSLGRKRLMEAKNASKVYRAQAKQSKDHDSSGESDTAGKRIVEKLRSDVKGLKNALRRSRRGTRSKETLEAAEEGPGGKTHTKKHSILRRMSHVQSSDEYEANNDDSSPIGVGLPLLQRLKLLKEKQEREREEKEGTKFNTSGGNRTKTDEAFPTEAVGVSLPFSQKLKLLKQKELKDVVAHGISTVRTQATGVRFDKSTHEAKNIGLTGDPEKQDVRTKALDKSSDAAHKKKDFVECGRTSPKERPKAFSPVKEKSPTLNAFEIVETAENSSCSSRTQFETSANTLRAKEAIKAVPKSLGNISEVPKSKDAWKLLKKSSISPSKSRTKSEIGENVINKGISRKGVYISKSDTILEKQKSVETEEKRSGSASPPNGPASRKMTQRPADENLGERKGSRSGRTEPPGKEDKSEVAEATGTPTRRATDEKEVGENKKKIKKYNSISDLSPEYSGLPFVKKLKILNERQKLEELEKELLVRSVSLDVPDRRAGERGGVLVRSQSEAATIDGRVDIPNLRSEPEAQEGRFRPRSGPRPEFRDVTPDEKKRDIRSEGSIASPESNETLERRNLKSILKKLSAEDGAADDDRNPRNFGRDSTSGKRVNSDLKKLMRAPTVEGYAARHKKLTKSVTFDGDTPPSPADAVPGRPPDESLGQGLMPTKSTAILTLQLSNLSVVPIPGLRKEDRQQEKGTLNESGLENCTDGGGSEGRKSAEEDQWVGDGKDGSSAPCAVQDLIEEKFGMSPAVKRSDDEFFSDFKGGLLLVLQQFLEEVESNFQARFDSLRNEVKRRDEIILELQTKIWKLEVKNVEEAPHNSEVEILRRVAEVAGADPDSPEIIRHVGSARIRALGEELEFPYDSATPPHSSGGQTPSSRAARKSLESDALRQAGNSFQAGGVCSSFLCPSDDSASPGSPSARAENNFPLRRNDFRFGLKPSRFLDGYSGDSFSREKKNFLLRKDAARSPSRRGRGEELELAELPARKGQGTECRSRKNFGMDEMQPEVVSKSERARNGKKEVESRPKKSFINRMTSFQRTFSCSQDKNSDFIALDIDESSNSSDIENNDWEVQMLVEELAKKDPDWEADAEEGEEEEEEEETEWTSKADAEDFADVKQLQQELNTLKQVVRANDLTQLTGSELDILETIIEAKDQKITQITKSSSLTDEDKNHGQTRQMRICAALSDNGISEPRKKISLRQKIGRALSFDFQDVENTKPSLSFVAKRGAFLGKRSAFSCYLRQRRSATDLRHASGQLTNGALEDSHRISENATVGRSSKVTVGSSLPILAPSFLFQEKNRDPRTSLPFLCSRRFRPDSAECLSAAVGSSEETHQEGGGERDNEEPGSPLNSISRRETGIFGSPTAGGSARTRESHPGNSLNSFIKSMGQKVKQAMIGDVNSIRNQVPTISKLCDEQTSLKDAEVAVSEDSREAAAEADVGSAGGEASEILNFIDRDSKVEHSDS